MWIKQGENEETSSRKCTSHHVASSIKKKKNPNKPFCKMNISSTPEYQTPPQSDANTSSTNGSRRCTDWSKERGGSVKRSEQEAINQSPWGQQGRAGRRGSGHGGDGGGGRAARPEGRPLLPLLYIISGSILLLHASIPTSSSSSSYNTPGRRGTHVQGSD